MNFDALLATAGLRRHPLRGISIIFSGALLCLLLISAVPPVHAQAMYEPDHGFLQFSTGYQYQHFSNVFGRSFNTNGYNVGVTAHVVDWLTDPDWRIVLTAEGTAAFGFGGQTTGPAPSLSAKSTFLAGGPRVTFENRSRVEPWLHGLEGWEHLRFTQDGILGSNSAFGFQVGGGVDIHVAPRIYWRIQADYLGTHFQDTIQSNYSAGTGFIFNF